MTRKLLTVDEFRASAKNAGDAPEGTVIRIAVADPVAAGDGSRKIRFVFSDGTVDRSGDSIDPAGWNTDAFLKNPVALWAHNSSEPPIGRASNVAAFGKKLLGDIEFMGADISAFADSIYRMVLGGFIKAVSVGFIPLEYSFVNDNARPFGIDFKKQELLEISVCPVPCNPNALQEAKALGIDTGPLREWASKLLDEGGQILVPRNVLEETFRQAKTPRTVRQKYLAKSEVADWQMSAAADLPVIECAAWDGAAAAKRMLDGAGFDGDSPDYVKAARGFLIHDVANPMLRSSYALPFADVVDGELKAIKLGIAAAKSRVDQTDASAAVRNEAKAIAEQYDLKEVEKIVGALVDKAGRRISSANAALLQKAMDHHASATQCIKDVLASNAADDPDGDSDTEPDVDPPIPDVVALNARDQRIAEAKALRASAKL